MNNNRGLESPVMAVAYIDPFGAPEFIVDGVAYREMLGTEFVRSSFFARDRGELILRVKLVMPVSIGNAEHNALRAFVAGRDHARMMG